MRGPLKSATSSRTIEGKRVSTLAATSSAQMANSDAMMTKLSIDENVKRLANDEK